MIISVDPGVQGCGIAEWRDGVLYKALYGDPTFSDFGLEDEGLLVIEKPQTYVQSKWKGDPNDLIDLAVVVGQLKERAENFGAPTVLYRPREWAGQVPKEIRWARAQKLLSDDELSRIEWPKQKGLKHNVWDAIGIGLFYLKRRRL